jgi:flagellar hook protein FlgE
MGLASALGTALTGLSASETTIDVVGNNLANSNTVGFKASQADFATQFLQTQSLGSAPTANSGGTNPEQVGLGAIVSQIVPNFTQGTVQNSTNPSAMAIQGDGFFIVQGDTGQELFTRNGQFQMNESNDLVTSTGNRVLGYGVNDQFQLETTSLQPINIPLGTAVVAQATQNVTMQGTLTPTGTVADQASILQTGILSDAAYSHPTVAPKVAADPSGSGNLNGQYTYYVTFSNGTIESQPSPAGISATSFVNGKAIVSVTATGDPNQWTVRNVYRSVNDPPGNNNFYLVGTINGVTDATATLPDNTSDATLIANGQTLDLNGPKINSNTLLSNVVSFDGSNYNNVFPDLGTLAFTGRKGDRALTTQSMQVTSTTTVGELLTFMSQSLGIQGSPGSDPNNPIPVDGPTGDAPGGSVTTDGRMQLVGNNGTDNSISIDLSGLQLTTNTIPSKTEGVTLPFNSFQTAKGQSATADMIVYDSLGIPLSVRITAVLQQTTSSATIYRWFADCGANDPATGRAINVGSGVMSFDGSGNFVSASNSTVAIDRAHEPSVKPLQFKLDFTQISGLAADKASLTVSKQDGSGPGTLTSYNVADSGLITGVFSNGVTRTVGQIRLARFSNPQGLEQRGQNLYATGVNSGLPLEGNPGDQGIGSIVAGATEASNTDVGSNLIDLITASTMYRSNARVINTIQQMFDDLLALQR